ncbi:histidine phosphatase family protein [Enterococcus sp. HY326]|uniref:histidine phosphatase family protein n=1 Tax=Enterococcus sp. HY326 TaxID=2971265 RepID=UPI00223FB71A|nr:histidine phosphatase family protein [Enterococcus sp. HY326]
MKKTFYLMRHAQTLFNVRKKIQGWCDAPLTELGREQAALAGEYIKKANLTFDKLYSSTSERACDTLEIITNQPYTRLKGLKEWNFGLFEGESEDLNPPLPYRDFFANYGGEEEKEFQQRTVQTCEQLMSAPDVTTVLAMSHGAFCGQFRKYWDDYSIPELRRDADIPLNKKRIGNCAIFKYDYEDGIFSLSAIINDEAQTLFLNQ